MVHEFVSPDVVTAFQSLCTALVFGAAIFRIQREAANNPRVHTAQAGRQDAIARAELGGDNAMYVLVPTAARVELGIGSNKLEVVDIRKKESDPRPAKLLIDVNGGGQGGLIENPGKYGVNDVSGVQVNYLGSINNNLLKGRNLQEVFEQGL